MARFIGLAIQSACGQCARTVAFNGPMRTTTCWGCGATVDLEAEALARFIHFVDGEYDAWAPTPEKGRPGLVGVGASNAYCNRPPVCSQCGTALELVANGFDGTVSCRSCAAQHASFPAPPWLRALYPAAVQCYCAEREAGGRVHGSRAFELSCASCGSRIPLAPDTPRSTRCASCGSNVQIPDDVWQRLHPAAEAQLWYLVLEGPSGAELEAAEDRRHAALTQQAVDARLRAAPAPRNPNVVVLVSTGLSCGALVLLVFLALIAEVAVQALGIEVDEQVLPVAGVGIALLLALALAVLWGWRATLSKRGKCRRAMVTLARKLGMEYVAGRSGELGKVVGTLDGFSITIDPEGHGISVEAEDSRSVFLQSEPHAIALSGWRRFDFGAPDLDRFFVVRWAHADLAAELDRSRQALAPIGTFWQRWGRLVSKMEVSRRVACHLREGDLPWSKNSRRYLPAEQLEPLLFDLVALLGSLPAMAALCMLLGVHPW